MKILIWMLLSIGGIVVLVVALFIFLWIRSIRVSLRRDQQLSEMTAPVISAIDENKTIDSALVFNLCEKPLTRAHFLSELLERKREDFFNVHVISRNWSGSCARRYRHKAECDFSLFLSYSGYLSIPYCSNS